MRFRFDREALAWAVLIFVVEVLIATAWSHHRFLRGFIGDLLAVVWVFYSLKTVIQSTPTRLALAAFAVGCLVEAGQYLAAINDLHVAHPVLRIVLGAVADWWDVLAYACGAVAAVGLEMAIAGVRQRFWVRPDKPRP